MGIKALGGVEDLVFGAGTEEQNRGGVIYAITRINASKIPFSGDSETGDVVTITEKINSIDVTGGEQQEAITANTEALSVINTIVEW